MSIAAIKQDFFLQKFFQAFHPTSNNNNQLRDLSGFSIFIGHNYENNENFSYLPFKSDNVKVKEVLKGERYTQYEETDNYFTPNLFINKASSRRTESSLAWLTSLYLDIDGIEGITDPEEGLKRLYKLCKTLNIPKPNIVLCTSINPTVHLQVYWLIDPIYVANDNRKYIGWWEKTAKAISESLGKDTDFNIDEGASKDPVRFMRIPYSYNQKTKQFVDVIDYNIPTGKRLTLRDFNHLKRSHDKANRASNTRFNSTKSSDKLLDHPQIQQLLKGVPGGYRNLSQYAIAKCCYADGLSVNDAIDVVLEQNTWCSVLEKESKVIDVVKRAYGVYGPESNCFYNLRAEIVADTVNSAFSTNFEPDQHLYRQYRRSIGRNQSEAVRDKYNSKAETIRKIIYTIIKLLRQGNKYLPKQKELAQIAGVKYSSLRHYFNKYIIDLLDKLFSIKVLKVGRNNQLQIGYKYQSNYRNDTQNKSREDYNLFRNILLSKSPIDTVLSRGSPLGVS